MLKLYTTVGLPGSGKSTWANKFIDQNKYNTVGITRDLLRKMCWNNNWNGKVSEQFIIDARDSLIELAYKSNKNVVLHDTNFGNVISELTDKFKDRFTLEVVDFTSVPLETCILRDHLRPKDSKVGAKVILRMYNQYLKDPNSPSLEEKNYLHIREPQLPLPSDKPKCYIMDIDGTIAWMSPNRSSYEWLKVGQDSLNVYMAELWTGLQKVYPYKYFVLSGRDSICRNLTEKWLDTHNVKYDALYMRPENDNRKDYDIKKELFETYIKSDYQVMGVFDDRLQVCKLWHELGLPLFRLGNPTSDF